MVLTHSDVRNGPARRLRRHGIVTDMQAYALARSARDERELCCVSSGYMSDGRSCTPSIPAGVVSSAWSAERERSGESRFFSFPWRGEIWLAFGLSDGQTRGVYCPAHRAQRDARSSGCEAQHYGPAAATGA